MQTRIAFCLQFMGGLLVYINYFEPVECSGPGFLTVFWMSSALILAIPAIFIVLIAT